MKKLGIKKSQTNRGLTPENYIYDVLRMEERRRERRARKLAERERSRPKIATGKARICKNCGLWIQRRRILYTEPNGTVKDYGFMYIHVNVKKWQHDIIERCYPEPRPIPTKRTA